MEIKPEKTERCGEFHQEPPQPGRKRETHPLDAETTVRRFGQEGADQDYSGINETPYQDTVVSFL
jgi:hypothetical protein